MRLPTPSTVPTPARAPVADRATPPGSGPGVPLARALRDHGDRLAVVAAGGETLTYAHLADQVDRTLAVLGPDRRLVLIAGPGGLTGSIEPLVTYLAALAGGHPVLLTGAGDQQVDALISTYDPDVLLRPGPDGWRLSERGAGRAHRLHPDLALLLSTSGSTGSAKLVRLGAAGVQANAEAIASYLDIRPGDRAPVGLPIHYCYGLSVVNSNLLRGAGLLLTDASVTDERFWTMFHAHGGTSLHGVPHTFDLLRGAGFDGMDLPTLRYVTQAGGALDPRRVRELALLGRRRGWRLFVMYGQTEATARMAYLPPELAASRPEAIGLPVAGGSFEIVARPDAPLDADLPPGADQSVGAAAAGESEQGELVYRGPNVMLGYAESAADLTLGRVVDALATGDLARRAADGLYEIVGRASRFVKLFGLRIDLDQAERILADEGLQAACVGTDQLLTAVVAGPGAERATHVLRARLRLPATHVLVLAVETLPRRPNGKVDYPAVRALTTPVGTPPGLRAQFARVLGRAQVPDDATFVGLGGDSLTYVQMSLEIERAIGSLPAHWPTMPVADLERLARDASAQEVSGRDASGRVGAGLVRAVRATRTTETEIILRAVAVVLIVANHIGLFHLLGGAHLLLVVAGWSFARFALAPRENGPSRQILRAAGRIAVPSMLWLAWRAAGTSDVGLSNVLLIDNYLRRGVPGYWFVEVLVQLLVALAALFAIPAVRRWERRHGFAFAAGFLGLALLANLPTDGDGTFPSSFYVTHGAAWFFALGWLACRAPSTPARLAVLVVATATVPGYFADPTREAVVLTGLALLLLLPRVVLPAPAVALAGLIASASLYTYLTHYAVYEWSLATLGPLPELLLCLAVGAAAAAAAGRLRRLPAAVHRAPVRERVARVGPSIHAALGRLTGGAAVLPAWTPAVLGGLTVVGSSRPRGGPAGPILLGQPLATAYGRLNRPG